MQVTKYQLSHDGDPRCIETNPLIRRTSVMKELKRSLSIILQKSVLASFKAELTIFSVKIFFHEYSRFTGQQGKREAFSLYSFFYFHSLHRHLDISWVIAAESSPLLEQPKA